MLRVHVAHDDLFFVTVECYAIMVYIAAVFVCLSITSWCFITMAEHIIKQMMLHNSLDSSSLMPKILATMQWVTPY